MVNKVNLEHQITLLVVLINLFFEGDAECVALDQNNVSIDEIGCWKSDAIQNILNNGNLVSFDITATLNRGSCGNNIVEECAQLTRNLGYSVFFINFDLKQPCLTGSRASYIHTSFDRNSRLDCNKRSEIGNKTYVYSLIGTLSDIFTNDNELSTTSENKSSINAVQHASIPHNIIELYEQYMGETINKDKQEQSIASEQPSQHNLKNQPSIVGTGETMTSENNYLLPQSLSRFFSFSSDNGMGIDEKTLKKEHAFKNSDNILQNPSFENAIENSALGWVCQGRSRKTTHGFLSQELTHNSDSSDKYAGRCANRKTKWVGPGQYIGRFLKPERSYRFSCKVRLVAETSINSKDKEDVQVWLQYEDRNVLSQSNTIHNKLLAQIKQPINDVLWEEIFTDFHVPVFPNKIKYAFISVNGPRSDVDILLDACKLSALPKSDDEWIRETDAAIDKNRKRTVKVRLIVPKIRYSSSDLFATKIQINQKRSLFGFGAAIHHKPLMMEKYRNFFLENFEWSVLENEMKWTQTETMKGILTYQKADKMVDFLLKNDKKIRGHCIFWASEGTNPEWLKNTSARHFRESLESRLHNVVTRYKGNLEHWDVNNEMLHGKYYEEKLNDPSIPQWMFHKTKELDPRPKMFLNDLDIVANSLLTKAFVNQAKDFLRQATPVEGLGAQGHFTGVVDPATLKDRLDLLMTANLPIWLTEVDIVEHDPHKRAKSLENILRVSFSHPGVHGIMFWCFWSRHCWRGASTGLVDGYDFKLTEAGRVYQDLRKQWTTNLETSPDQVTGNVGHFSFRGFHGDYEMITSLPDGQIIVKNFTIKPDDGDLQLTIDVFEQN